MKKALFLLSYLLIIIMVTNCYSDSSTSASSDYIIADHTAVDQYNKIPQKYIDIVKTWLVDAAGESHSEAYRTGIADLEVLNSRFQVETFDGGLPAKSTTALRLGRHASVGEGTFWTNNTAITNIKNLIASQHNADNPIHVIFQAWCWDLTRGTGTAEYDNVYGCHWFGSTEGGIDGDLPWGLDSNDVTITKNRVSLQHYLAAVDEYNEYADSNGYETVAIFTTGPVDGDSASGEKGYQRFVKHQAIRDYVKKGGGRVLFDYADILAYNDAGERNMLSWTSPYNNKTNNFPAIHTANDAEDTGHISNTGALRIAKAMWWILARMAGWDGN